jgi:hypothetical protein
MGRACSMNGGEKECIYTFGRIARKQENARKIKM